MTIETDLTKKKARKKTVRKKNDAYQTDPILAERVLALLHDEGQLKANPRNVLEPSAGEGNFVDRLRDCTKYESLTAIDLTTPAATLIDRGADEAWTGDFLQFVTPLRFDLIVGNPPYSEACRHVVRAVELLSEGGTLAFLLRLGFLESQERIPFWREMLSHLKLVAALSERPSFTGGGTDQTAYGVFVWRKPYRPDAERERAPEKWEGAPPRLTVWSWR